MAKTLFCSLACLQFALNHFHPTEAKVNLAHIFQTTASKNKNKSNSSSEDNFDEISGSVRLALRAFVLDNQQVNTTLKRPTTKRINLLQDMISHQGLVKTNEESLSLVVKTVLVLELMKKMGIVEVAVGLSPETEEEVEVGVVIAQVLEVIQFNTHPIDQVRELLLLYGYSGFLWNSPQVSFG